MTEAILTLVLMVMFIGGCLWVYRPAAKAKYQAAARIPFEEKQGTVDEDLNS
jgi:cbb3-type cytochrome oxidase subunit 3